MNEPTNPPEQYLGIPGEDPTRPWYASGNYTGQNWSDGKNQSSVEFGSAPVMNELDELAYYHDTAYAHYKDDAHREAADQIFYEKAMKLDPKYGAQMKEDPRIAGKLVLYGNYTKRKAASTAQNFARFGLGGLIYQGGKNIVEMNSRLNGTYLKTEKQDLNRLYETNAPNRAYVPGSNGESQAKGKVKVTPGEAAQTLGKVVKAIKHGAEYIRDKVKVTPAPVETKAEKNQRLVSGQADRFNNHIALHDAALASQGQPGIYHKRQLNLNAAKPKKKKKKKRNAILPA